MTDIESLIWAAAFAAVVTNEEEQRAARRPHPGDPIGAQRELARFANESADAAVSAYRVRPGH